MIAPSAEPLHRSAAVTDFRPMTLRRLIWPLLENWKLILAGLLIPAILVYLLTFFMARTYSATANILVEERRIDLGEISEVVTPSTRDSSTVASQIEIILSDPVLEATARAVGTLPEEDDGDTARLIQGLETLRGQLEVSQRLNSLVVDVTAHARSPERAALIANAVAEAYLTVQVEAQQEVAQNALTWMEGQIGALRSRIYDINQRINDLRRNTLEGAKGDLATLDRQIELIVPQISEARVAFADAQAAHASLAAIFADAGVAAAAELVSSGEIDRQISIRAQLVLDRETELVKRGGRHPAVEALTARIAAIDATLTRQVEAAIDAAQAKANLARERFVSLERASTELQSRAIDLADTQQSLLELEQELEANEGLYVAFLERFNEIASQSLSLTTDARVLADALPPLSASGPRRGLMAALVGFLGVAAAIGWVLLRETLGDRYESLEDIEAETGIPIVELAPLTSLPPPSEMHEKKTDPEEPDSELILSPGMAASDFPVMAVVMLDKNAGSDAAAYVAQVLGRFRGGGSVKVIHVSDSASGQMTGLQGSKGIHVESANAQEIIDPAARHAWSDRLASYVTMHSLVLVVPPPPDNGSLSALWASLADVTLLATRDPRPSRQVVQSIASRISGWGGKVGGILILSRDVSQPKASGIPTEWPGLGLSAKGSSQDPDHTHLASLQRRWQEWRKPSPPPDGSRDLSSGTARSEPDKASQG